MLVLPMRMAPASRSRPVTVDSYGGYQPSRIFDPQVAGAPMVANRSFTATGTPASAPSRSPAARLRSTARACASASSPFTCRNARTSPSTAVIRSRWAWVTSAADTLPAATAAASSAAVIVVRSSMVSPSLLDQDPRHLEPLHLDGGSPAERLLGRQPGDGLVVTVNVVDAGRVRGRRNAVRGFLLHLRDRRDDLVELRGKVVELFVAEREPGQPGQVSDLVAGNGHAFHPRADGARTRKRLRVRSQTGAKPPVQPPVQPPARSAPQNRPPEAPPRTAPQNRPPKPASTWLRVAERSVIVSSVLS